MARFLTMDSVIKRIHWRRLPTHNRDKRMVSLNTQTTGAIMDRSYKDYYRILGVEITAGIDEIKKRFRQLALQSHPDVNRAPGSEARFKELNEAYETLKNPKKRAIYDRAFRSWVKPAPTPGASTFHEEGNEPRPGSTAGGFGEPLDGFLFRSRDDDPGNDQQPTNHYHNGHGGASWFPPPLSLAKAHRLDITLEEAFNGCHKQFAIYTRTRKKVARIRVEIPPGVIEGQTIHLRRKPTSGGAPMENLYFTIHIRPHDLFHLDGRDSHVELSINLWEAVFGATVTVPTLGGPVKIKIPPHSHSGKKLILKGHGLPGADPGRQIITLKVILPELSSDTREELSRWMKGKPGAMPTTNWQPERTTAQHHCEMGAAS